MKCNKCHINDVTIKKQVLNDKGEFELVYLCDDCQNLENKQSAFKSIDIASFLKQEEEACIKPSSEYIAVDGKKFLKKMICCDVCGQTELDIKNSQLPGCSNCYKVFKLELQDAIDQFQLGENLKHTGKVIKDK